MLKKIYIHNYKCFQNFEFNCEHEKSLLIFGKNGVGKSSILNVLMILKNIANGENRLANLFPKYSFLDINSSIIIEIELFIRNENYKYTLQVEYTENFFGAKIRFESLSVDGKGIYSRNETGLVNFNRSEFTIDWHSVALPLLIPHDYDENSHLFIFKNWLAKMVLVAPIPELIKDNYEIKSKSLDKNTSNFVGWLSNILSQEPRVYSSIERILKDIFNDFSALVFPTISPNELNIRFKNDNNQQLSFRISDLSDGERLFIIYSTMIALSELDDDLFCFWDEPENYISISMVERLISLFRAKVEYSNNKQLFITSHNREIVNSFSTSEIFILSRIDHFSPTRVESADKIYSSTWHMIEYME